MIDARPRVRGAVIGGRDMDIRLPGRTMTVEVLRPGACFLAQHEGATALCLLIGHRHRIATLILNRPDPVTGDLPIVTDLAGDADVLLLPGAVLAPSGAFADIVLGRVDDAGRPAVYLGDACAYLRGRTADGQVLAIEVVGGRSSAIDLAFLPRSLRWRVVRTAGDGGQEIVFESGAA